MPHIYLNKCCENLQPTQCLRFTQKEVTCFMTNRTFLQKTERLVTLSQDVTSEYQNIVNFVGWYRDPDILRESAASIITAGQLSSALIRETKCWKSGLTNKKCCH
jgi:hypothetical protein